MKIGTILTACNDNPLYSEFIPNFIKAWEALFPDADVLVVYIGDSIPDEFKNYAKNIRLSKPIEGIHSAFHSQCIRLLYPRHIERNDAVLITDMDMLPMNKKYYIDNIATLSDDTFVAYRDAEFPKEITMCYIAATPTIWTQMFGDESDETLLKRWNTGVSYSGIHGGSGWTTDQLILCERFKNYSGKKIMLRDSSSGYRRLCRLHTQLFSRKEQIQEHVDGESYCDYHCLRPHSRYSHINDYIVECLLKKYN